MLCAYCELWDVEPESPALLCVSCEWSVRFRMLAPKWYGESVYLVVPPASYANPLGFENGEDEGKLYMPTSDPELLAELCGQLFRLYHAHDRLQRVRAIPRTIVEEVRACGAQIYLDIQNGVPQIVGAHLVPYHTLAQFATWIVEVASALSDERAEEIAERNRLISAIVESGIVENVQVEHFRKVEGAERGNP